MSTSTDRRGARHRRHRRVRRRVQGTPVRPRLSVFRSAKHISAQVIDDSTGTTVASATTLQAGVADGLTGVAAATEVGRTVAERAKAAGIESVVFDRGGYLYHGRVAALADGARDAGLEF
ncbi:MAG: 50S ribosomal protein L18 [Acidimicrobiales bacterium]|mgnify:CR=1 FL=1|nr:50S ribosomal protein L18 [Acidimicrobiaceae bacterium]MDP6975386.1 50S ribosomal protein L18 [Acidimicrobiales bacterium]